MSTDPKYGLLWTGERGMGWGSGTCKQLVPSAPTPVSRLRLLVRRQAGKQRDLGSNPFRLSFLFKSCGLWTLSCGFVPHNYETLKWLSSLPTLMHKSIWWCQCSCRYIISNPAFPPFSPSLINLMVFVDVKHHVYLLTDAASHSSGAV